MVLLVQLGFAFGGWEVSDAGARLARGGDAAAGGGARIPRRSGMLIYTSYVLLFQLAGLMLLVAMIGAIVLTLRKRAWVKRQDVLAQMYRDPKTAVADCVDIKPGQGL